MNVKFGSADAYKQMFPRTRNFVCCWLFICLIIASFRIRNFQFLMCCALFSFSFMLMQRQQQGEQQSFWRLAAAVAVASCLGANIKVAMRAKCFQLLPNQISKIKWKYFWKHTHTTLPVASPILWHDKN